jgi:hypothetical protein
MFHKMSVVKTSSREVLFTGTEKQCEWFIDQMNLKFVADCPLGTTMWVR